MKNMEREKFEESLKNAFDQAEIAPSEKVWTNIELDLEKEKGGNLKKRLMFYQMLAAASVIFALGIGSAGLYFSLRSQDYATDQIAQQVHPSSDASAEIPARDAEVNRTVPPVSQIAPPSDQTSATGDNTAVERSGPISASGDRPATAVTDPSEKSVINAGVPDESFNTRAARNDRAISTTDGTITGNESLVAGAVGGNDLRALHSNDSERPLPPLYSPREIRLNIPVEEKEKVDPVVAMLARLEQREKEVQGTEKNKKNEDDLHENLWTSIGFAAGSFNNVQSSASASPAPASTASMALAAPIVDQETKASGYSYSMGVNVGKKLSDRWVLQGGVNYLTHASEYTANNVVVSTSNLQQQRFRAASTNELVNATEKDLSNKIVYSAPYNVNNSMRYLSIPLQAGYLLVNKTFGLQINAGVATDVFLQNTIRADSDQLDKISQPGGSDSPYRSLNLSGLFGTEFSYRFGDHYRIALNPGLRYPLNTIYKSDMGIQTTPLTFDVGLRFRYIFH
jgi:hypothetical protein